MSPKPGILHLLPSPSPQAMNCVELVPASTYQCRFCSDPSSLLFPKLSWSEPLSPPKWFHAAQASDFNTGLSSLGQWKCPEWVQGAQPPHRVTSLLDGPATFPSSLHWPLSLGLLPAPSSIWPTARPARGCSPALCLCWAARRPEGAEVRAPPPLHPRRVVVGVLPAGTCGRGLRLPRAFRE